MENRNPKVLNSITIVPSQNVINQIKFLCNAFPDVEWSGHLFYKILEGDIHTTCKIELIDILPIDIGSSAHTEFEPDERIMQYKMAHPDRDDYLEGMIHSHNKMAVSPSQLDKDNLIRNSELYSFFLSVIVNNKLDMSAQMGLFYEPKVKELEYFFGLIKKSHKVNPIIDIINCIVIQPKENFTVSEEFLKFYNKMTTSVKSNVISSNYNKTWDRFTDSYNSHVTKTETEDIPLTDDDLISEWQLDIRNEFPFDTIEKAIENYFEMYGFNNYELLEVVNAKPKRKDLLLFQAKLIKHIKPLLNGKKQ